jgi:hypothetical protein
MVTPFKKINVHPVLWYRYSFKPFYSKWKEKTIMSIVWLLPKELVKWAVIRAFAHASSGRWSRTNPAMLTYHEVITRWGEKNK